MSEPFIIELWSDVVCPFCYLGTRQLEQALALFEHRAQVVTRLRAFELDPNAPTNYNMSLPELLAQKYGMSLERARAANEHLEGEARALGMTWSLERALPTNTFDAHRLIALAATQGLGEPMAQRLFLAYFSQNELLSDHGVLDQLANDVGVVGASELWAGDQYSSDVRNDELRARELAISGVPSMLIDNRVMVVGAQGTQKILEGLERAWARRGD
ncbi:MAG: DsbA family oxidoreductase [Acidimicrobiales bacterium]